MKLRINASPSDISQTSVKYQFGNYDQYYNYRYAERWRDERINRFDKTFFLNKKCLDIGCNDGSLTL